jgi:hypothetical protein
MDFEWKKKNLLQSGDFKLELPVGSPAIMITLSVTLILIQLLSSNLPVSVEANL